MIELMLLQQIMPAHLEEKQQSYLNHGGPLVQHAVVAMFEAHQVVRKLLKMCHNPAKIFKIKLVLIKSCYDR
jgi:dihydroorotase